MNDELKQQLIDASKRIAIEIIKLPGDTVFSIKQLAHDVGYGFNNQELGLLQKLVEKILAKKLIFLHYGAFAGQDHKRPYELSVQKARNLAFSVEVPHYNGKLTRGKTVSEKRYFIQKSDVAHVITQRKKFVQENTNLYTTETIDVPVIYSVEEGEAIRELLQQLDAVEENHQKIDATNPRDALQYYTISSAKHRLTINGGDPVFQELCYRTFNLADTMLEPTEQ